MQRLILMLFFLALPSVGQVTSVGTEGKGAADIFCSWSYYPSADGNTSTDDCLWLYGLTDKLDLIAGPAINVGSGQHQSAVEVGLQYKLWEKNGFRVMTLELANLSYSNRGNGTHTLFASLTINKDLSVMGWKFTPYIGYGPTVPLGPGGDKLFSSKDSVHNFPAGIMVPVGERLQVFLESGLNRPVYFSGGLSYNIKKGR